MSEFPHFPKSPVVLATVAGAPADTPANGCVNGIPFSVPRNTPTRLPMAIVDAIENAGFPISYSETDPAPAIEGDGAAADGGAVSDDGAPETDPFDPEPFILGNVDDVIDRLAELTPEQLAAVAAAETDREKPRKGVLEVIDKLLIPTAE